MAFRRRDEIVRVGPGELVFAPRGVPHPFANLSGAPAREACLCAPGGFERHLARMGSEAS